MTRRGAVALAIAAAIAVTLAFACVALLAASLLIFDWGGADLFSGEADSGPAWWAVPSWIAVTAALVVIDVILVRLTYRRARRSRKQRAHER
jgi:H+/Cl- antiporter ClcA